MNAILPGNVTLKPVATPDFGLPVELPVLPDSLFRPRLERFRAAMKTAGLDAVVVYADREHYANFRYLVGFEPRFEEGVLVVTQNDPSYILLGNECFPMHPHAKIPAKGMLCQILSLPNQPMDAFTTMRDSLAATGLSGVVGVAGWKIFTARGDATRLFCAPAFLVDAVRDVVGADNVVNATGLFTDPARGLRTINEADQIAVYEYGSATAGQGVLNVWNALTPGKSELELADNLITHGLPLSCHPIVAGGPNTRRGLVSPTSYRVKKGDPFCVSAGLEGGLSCRGGYLVEKEADLPAGQEKYLESVIKPYYAAVASWYETVGIGVAGGAVYDLIQSIFPKEKYGWVLNPGHLIGNEEWLSSPIYPGSTDGFKSGMIVQMDIIPAGDFVSPNAEDGVLLADEALRGELQSAHPGVWERMTKRRDFMRNSLGIKLGDDVLPMSNLAGLYRPLALNKTDALTITR